MKVITDDEIRSVILPRLALSAVLHSQAVAFHSLATSQCPPRLSLRTPRHTQLFMPARTDVSVIKIVSVPVPCSGLSGIPGTNLVFDDGTGRLSHVVDSSCLTALRTAGGSLLSSIVALGRGGRVREAVCFGDGLQAVFHVWLHGRYFAMEKVVVVVGLHRKLTADQVAAKERSFRAQLGALGGREIEVQVVTAQDEAVKEALRDSQLVFTCTPSTQPLFNHSDLGQGRTHICAVGSYKPHMVELPPQTVVEAKRVLVDSVAACVDEAGCLLQAIPDRKGLEERCTELGGLLPSTQVGDEAFMEKLQEGEEEEEEEGVTLFKSVGVGLQDVEITKVVVRLAEEIGGVGSDVPF